MISKIIKWIKEMRYRYFVWQLNRSYTKTKREIGKMLAPALKKTLKDIEAMNDKRN